MSSTAGDKGQGGQFGAKEARARRSLLAASFIIMVLTPTAGDEGQGGRIGAKGVGTRGSPLAAIFRVLTPKE